MATAFFVTVVVALSEIRVLLVDAGLVDIGLFVLLLTRSHSVSDDAAFCLSNTALASYIVKNEIDVLLTANGSGESLILGPIGGLLLLSKTDRVQNTLHFFHQRDHVRGYLCFQVRVLAHSHLVLVLLERNELAIGHRCGLITFSGHWHHRLN